MDNLGKAYMGDLLLDAVFYLQQRIHRLRSAGGTYWFRHDKIIYTFLLILFYSYSIEN